MSAIRRFHCIPNCNLFQIKWGGVNHLSVLVPELYIHKSPTKYSQTKTLDPQNAYKKKFRTHKIPTVKNVGSQNTHKRNFGPTKYPQEKISDPQNNHQTKIWTHEIPTR